MSAKPIAYNPVLAELSNSATAGLFMSQLLYWWDKGRYQDWIYKTIEDVWKETRLTRSEQDTAIARWTKLGVLEKQLRQVPAKRFFRIHTDKLVDLYRFANLGEENDKLDCGDLQTITEKDIQEIKRINRTFSTLEHEETRNRQHVKNRNR